MLYSVCFYKNNIFTDDYTRVKVNAQSHDKALKNARKKGYLRRDGWKCAYIVPNPKQ